ncbi:MAG: sigma-70 family RNA polymerase sigma factor [Myxococcota bacterium]|nr:sigma-70 family RNA polymerase sigma factor [Myxococcota bacterium]
MPSHEASAGAASREARREDDDRALVRRVAQGDRSAFEALYHRYARRLGGFLFKLLRQDDLVEEALNDVMLVVWEKADRYDPAARVSTWLFGIAYRKALKARERTRRHRRAGELPEGTLEGPARPDDPEEAAVRSDQLRRLAGGIEALSPDQRAVVELTFFEGRSYAEIAEVMGCPLNTVKTRMFHARKQLRRHLGRWVPEGQGGADAAR